MIRGKQYKIENIVNVISLSYCSVSIAHYCF